MYFKRLKEKCSNLKTWQWFLLLYLGGSIALISISYGMKLLMAALP
jgi:hypothetical protein